MSLRSKTLKAEKYGTPVTPTITTPKTPSPKEPQIIKTIPQVVVTGTKVSSKTHPRTAISFGVTPTQEGVKAQQSFTQKLYSVTVPIKNEIDRLKDELLYYTSGTYMGAHTGSTIAHKEGMEEHITKQIHNKEIEIDTIVEDIINIELQANVNQIIQAIESGRILTPDYFHNNIAWVKDGSISQQTFLDAYYTLSNQGIIHSAIIEPIEEIIEEPLIELPELLPEVIAEPEINDSITDNMVTQQVINFNIVNGRAIGSIKFTATNNFNSFYYGKNIINIIQFKDPNGANILTYVKQNRLNFTETERTELIHYDEDMQGNTRAIVNSFVWEWADKPAGAFSKMYSINISETEEPKPVSRGILGAGVAGAIGILILLGFVADYKRK